MDTTPFVSLIILTWNRKEDLKEILNRIGEIRYSSLEVLVVDNNSTDGTDILVQNEFPHSVYVKLDENRGIAGYNRGIQKAKGKYLVFLDSDSFPASHSISKMVHLFETHPQVGAIAFDVHHSETWTEDVSQNPDPARLTQVSGYNGAGAGFRSSLFEKTGLLEENLFLYANEIDHSIRILNAGYRILYSPEIVAYHKNSTSSRMSTSAPYFFTRNLLWVVWKYYPLLWSVRLSLRMVYFSAKSTISQRTGIYVRALWDACKGFPEIWSHRSVVNETCLRQIRLPIPLIFTWYK